MVARKGGPSKGPARLDSREGTKVSTLALPAQLHRRLHIAALDRGVAAAQLIRQAVEEWLDRHAGKGGAR